jgi:hypothetical protein
MSKARSTCPAGDVEVAGDHWRHAEVGVECVPVEAGTEVPAVGECGHHEPADDPVVGSGVEETGDAGEGYLAEVVGGLSGRRQDVVSAAQQPSP